jgi:hypothetical protein
VSIGKFVNDCRADQTAAAYQLKSVRSKYSFNGSKKDKIQRIRLTAPVVQLMGVQFVTRTARCTPVDAVHSTYIPLSVDWVELTRDYRYGWCGNTPDYCGNGCISGCVPSSPPSEKPKDVPRSDGRCGKDFDGVTCDPNGPYGGCCSQYGYVYLSEQALV